MEGVYSVAGRTGTREPERHQCIMVTQTPSTVGHARGFGLVVPFGLMHACMQFNPADRGSRLWFASYRLINWLVKSRRFLIILVAAPGDSP